MHAEQRIQCLCSITALCALVEDSYVPHIDVDLVERKASELHELLDGMSNLEAIVATLALARTTVDDALDAFPRSPADGRIPRAMSPLVRGADDEDDASVDADEFCIVGDAVTRMLYVLESFEKLSIEEEAAAADLRVKFGQALRESQSMSGMAVTTVASEMARIAIEYMLDVMEPADQEVPPGKLPC